MASEDKNFRAFSSQEAVEFYAGYAGLEPAETYAFATFIPGRAAILDIGVGAGRTTPFLAAQASRYVGIDYVKAMVTTCIARYPQYSFFCTDATHLEEFEDASFNVVVFSFNGIDAIPTLEGRLRCLSAIYRVLTSDGIFIFSSHNARMLVKLPSSENVGPLRALWRLARSTIKSLPQGVRLVRSGAFRAGEGYYLDPAHGGITGYCSIPKLIERDVCAAGFRLLEIIDSTYPQKLPRYCTPWYYYVCSKRGSD